MCVCETFLLDGKLIIHSEKYCYLGIIFHQNGSFSMANNELRAKALRAFFGLKGKIIKDSLSHKAKNILFDTLIKSILLYGCQVLGPHSKTIKYLYKLTDQSDPTNALKYIAQDHYEKFHLKFIKWCLSLHSKASNIGCWGESGRYPLFYEACKLSIDFFMRIKNMHDNSENNILAAAFSEQKSLSLPWYSNLINIIQKYDQPIGNQKHKRMSVHIAQKMRDEFVNLWKLSKQSSPKLEFYDKVKQTFQIEKYLSVIKNPKIRQTFTRYRISAHNLYIERGRYENPLVPREKRWCIFCYDTKKVKMIEDEIHVLFNCPMFEKTKIKNGFNLECMSSLVDLLNNSQNSTEKLIATCKTIHEILSINESYTSYYKTQDFHDKTGRCIVL